MNPKGWYYGWKATIYIHLFDRETLRRLKEPFEIGDFAEAESPEEILRRYEEQTLEGYLKWLESLAPGDLVCDCRFKHLKIVSRDDDDVLLEDGSSCSLAHCCDPADHRDPHPVIGFGDLDSEHGARPPKYGSDENF